MNRNFFFACLAWLFLGLAAGPVRAAETLPLAGEWRFALDRRDAGTNEHWFAKNLPDKIQLPGILEAQGYGDEISTRTPWVLSLYDHFWFLRSDYATDTNAGRVKVPFISQPPRHYLGAAWYQRDLEIPTNWSGQRVVLFLERPHWKSTVWLDDKEIGSEISLCTPHEFDFGTVLPGKHRLTVRVDNRMILPYRPDAHSVSDSLDNAWNGIVGRIELRATPLAWIDNVQIFPDARKKQFELCAVFHLPSAKLATGKISFFVEATGATPPLKVLPSSVNFNTTGPEEYPVHQIFELGDQAKLWDEFSPAQYQVRLTVRGDLGGENFSSDLTVPFGLRDFHADGNQFILNGRPIYFRGTHFGGDFPLTGYPPTDVASWKKIFLTGKEYGLNHMRFHSWCPPEAAFIAADEVGFYLQVECGMWNEISPGSAMEKMLYAETDRIIKAYGNHPSFLLLSAMNEAHGNWKPSLTKWVEHYRAADPRRLYTPDTGWSLIDSPEQKLNGGADYLDVGRIGQNRTRGESGWFGSDYGDSLAGLNVPVIAHELGQWVAYPDFDVIKKFTGFMQPGNYEIFRDSAAVHGLLEQNKNFALASGEFQLQCYQEEIEANLRTPGMAGFQLLDLHDYTGQGSAFVGLLDPFWGSKGYAPPGEFKKYCNAVVPLARMPQRVFTTDDQLAVPLEIANYGATALTNVTVVWRILDASGRGKAIGISNGHNIPFGRSALETISQNFKALNLPAPGRYRLQVYLQGTPFTNDWNFWLYPATISAAAPTNVFVTSAWNDAEKKLADGKKVLFLPHNADLSWWSPPLARVPVFWNALMGPTWSRMLGLWCDVKHPALAEFPTEAHCDWQWTELLRNTRAINLDQLPRGLTPIVSAIDDWNRNYKLGVIFEAKVGHGKLLVCSIDLNNNASPVAQQLRRSLLDYLAEENHSPKKTDGFVSFFDEPSRGQFEPRTEISLADFASLHFNTRIMHQLGATALADGGRADEIVDGDPNTFWSSADARGNGPKHPHEIQITFPQPVAMNGLVLMPRQNQREHQGDIREFKIEAGDDAASRQTVATGTLSSTFDPQAIRFAKTVTAKKLWFTALSGFGNDQSTAVAELALIYAGPKMVEADAGIMDYRQIRTASPDIDAGAVPLNRDEPKKIKK